MRCYTAQECEDWLADRKRPKPKEVPQLCRERLPYPNKPGKFIWTAQWISSTLTYRQPALLWITEWGIWEQTETSHLYYRLRQSYGDHRLLWEAPGHLFLGYEAEDLASFLQIAMLIGWGGYLLTDANYVNMFFSHDEYFDFFAENDSLLAPIKEQLTR